LQVGLLSSLSGALVPAAVCSLDWEGVEVGLTEGSLALLAERLRRTELDVAFCYSTGEPEVLAGLQIETIERRPVMVALPVDDALAEAYELAWADLATRPWIMPSASRQYREDMIERFQSRGFTARVVAEATTLAGQLALVAAGIGLSFTSPWAGVPAGVTTRPTAAPVEEIELLAVRPTGADPVVAGALIDAVRHAAQAVR
jgi:DNA-binding transcriptional LysR family regulator